jgi:hypothetical protein
LTVIHEIEQYLWVTTPVGDGQALFLIDYGPHENTVWVVALEEDGSIKHFNANQIQLCYNNTFGINCKDDPHKPYKDKNS